jgi:hypothetical protein
MIITVTMTGAHQAGEMRAEEDFGGGAVKEFFLILLLRVRDSGTASSLRFDPTVRAGATWNNLDI